MRELLVRGKNTIDPEVTDRGGRSVEDSPVNSDFTFTLNTSHYNRSFRRKELKSNREPNTITVACDVRRTATAIKMRELLKIKMTHHSLLCFQFSGDSTVPIHMNVRFC
jgi:hypothetical protein